MSEIPKRLVIDVEGGSERYVDFTPEEIEAREQAALAEDTARAEHEQEVAATATALATLKASARAKLVAGEPLTEEEANALTL